MSDFILYSVEAEFIDRVVAEFGPCTYARLLLSTKRLSDFVSLGQLPNLERSCLVKRRSRRRSELRLRSTSRPTFTSSPSTRSMDHQSAQKDSPWSVANESVHLHGSPMATLTRPPTLRHLSLQVLIQHRAPDEKLHMVERIFASFKSSYVYLSYEEHDLVTANTQAVTHAAFLRYARSRLAACSAAVSLSHPLTRSIHLAFSSMGTAWHCSAAYPWESGRYQGGIETVKINIALRIYANKWHVYAGLAILNPSARIQINQYAKSTTELFKLMVEGKGGELLARVKAARASVFGDGDSKRTPILLSDKILDQFSLGPKPTAAASGSSTPAAPRNSHLSLLAMVDCWHVLQILPFKHLELAATPLFRMWIGVAEYLFRDEARLEEAVAASLEDKEHRSDDTEFVVAARGWSQCVEFGSWEMYRERFERTAGQSRKDHKR